MITTDPNDKVAFANSDYIPHLIKADNLRQLINKELGPDYIVKVNPGYYLNVTKGYRYGSFEVIVNKKRGEAREIWERSYAEELPDNPFEMEIAIRRFTDAFEKQKFNKELTLIEV